MSFHPSRLAIAAVGSAIALAFIGSPSQASIVSSSQTIECNELIDTINEGIALIEDFEQKSRGFEAKTAAARDPGTMVPIMNEFADLLGTFTGELGTVTGELDAIPLKDATLVGFQQNYSSNLKALNGLHGQLAQALRDMSGVLAAIAATPRDRITPELAQQWAADAQKAEADVVKVETGSKTPTEAIDRIADDINEYCDREPPNAG